MRLSISEVPDTFSLNSVVISFRLALRLNLTAAALFPTFHAGCRGCASLLRAALDSWRALYLSSGCKTERIGHFYSFSNSYKLHFWVISACISSKVLMLRICLRLICSSSCLYRSSSSICLISIFSWPLPYSASYSSRNSLRKNFLTYYLFSSAVTNTVLISFASTIPLQATHHTSCDCLLSIVLPLQSALQPSLHSPYLLASSAPHSSYRRLHHQTTSHRPQIDH